ncbi:MAG: hypothetical protein N2738_07855, partial [Thermodesulfovibrionales bacterium]|nr:hypothetical protein [Thermodesulfovibrionales bacterium]
MHSFLSYLDLKTLIFISLLYTILFIMVMLHILFTRKVYEGFPYIIIGHVFVIVGVITALLLRGKINDFVSIFIGNLFLLLYPLCYYIGLMKFHRLPNTKAYLGFLLSLIIIGCIFIYIQEDLNKRVIIHSLIGAFIFILASVKPLLSETPRQYKIQRFMSLAILPIGIFYIYRAYYTYHYMPYSNFQLFIQNDNIMKVLFILSIFTAFMMFYCYLAMTSDRLAKELKEARERELEAMQNHQNLFSVVTHDLKTPITVINRSAQMIAHKLSRKDIEGAVQRLNTIKNNTLAMLSLIDQWQDNALLMTK